MKSSIRAALYQMLVESDLKNGDMKDRNMERVLHKIDSLNNIDLVVLPEEFYAGYGYSMMNIPNFVESGSMQDLMNMASEKDIFIAGGTSIRPKKILEYKSEPKAFIINSSGKIDGMQHRKNLSPKETQWMNPGNDPEVFETELGRIGLVSGQDLFDETYWEKFVFQKPEIIISPLLVYPNMHLHTQKPKYEASVELNSLIVDIQKKQAVKLGCYILSASAYGNYTHFDGRLQNHTRLVYPNGTIKALNNDEEGLLIVEFPG